MWSNSSSHSRALLQPHLLQRETRCDAALCQNVRSCVSSKATSCSALCELLGWHCYEIQRGLIWEVGFYFCRTTCTLPQWFAFFSRLTPSFFPLFACSLLLLRWVPFLLKGMFTEDSQGPLCSSESLDLYCTVKGIWKSQRNWFTAHQCYTGNSCDSTPCSFLNHTNTRHLEGIVELKFLIFSLISHSFSLSHTNICIHTVHCDTDTHTHTVHCGWFISFTLWYLVPFSLNSFFPRIPQWVHHWGKL